MRKILKRYLNKLILNNILKFILVGGCSTAIDFVIYMLLSMRLPITISKGISMIVASIFSYIANKSFTFRNKDKTNIKYLVRFYIVFVANFLANLGMNYIIYGFTENKIVAFALATLCGMTVNYLGQRFFVFNGKTKD